MAMQDQDMDEEHLRLKLEQVIEKSKAQKRILKKILSQLNKESAGGRVDLTESQDKEGLH